MSNPEQFEDFRVGDEPADAHIAGFKVYGGSPDDRRRLQEDDPEFIAAIESELDDTLTAYREQTD